MLNGSPVRRSMQASMMRLSAPMAHTLSPAAWAAWAWSSRGGSLSEARGVLSSMVEPSRRISQQRRPCRPCETCRNRLCARRYRFTGRSGAAGGGCRGDRTTIAGSRACGGRERRRRGRGALPGKVWNECGRPRWPAPCGCTQRRRPDSSTGGLASLRWLRFWVCRVKWRTQARTRGSTPWRRGDAHRVYPQPRSTGASGRTSG